jgi:hypothetical protein
MGHSNSTRRATRVALQSTAWLALTALATAAQAQGLVQRAQEASASSHLNSEYALTSVHSTGSSIRLFGDYYFYDPASTGAGPLLGGFRASTGVVGLAQPLSLYEARPDPLQNLPYVGLGYSHLYFNSQLSLNADFGLASQNRGHGLFNSASSLDDVTSQLRWAPVMAVNVRYSF